MVEVLVHETTLRERPTIIYTGRPTFMHEQVKVQEADASQGTLKVVCIRMDANTSTHRIPILHVPLDTQFRTSCCTRACKRLAMGVRREPGNLFLRSGSHTSKLQARICSVLSDRQIPCLQILVDQLFLNVLSHSVRGVVLSSDLVVRQY